MSIQNFGDHFDLQKLFHARDVGRELTYKLSSLIRPGMTEEEAHKLYKKLCDDYPITKQWHPPKIRFGKNTLKNFRDESEPYVLQEEDIYFIDIGPIVSAHEADYGETFVLGNIFDQKHIADSAKKVFQEVGEYWLKEKCDGTALYNFAQKRAAAYGYDLNMGSEGHRIGDFPHHIHFKGAIIDCPEVIIPNAWILEIHLYDKARRFGAFFEDILTDSTLE